MNPRPSFEEGLRYPGDPQRERRLKMIPLYFTKQTKRGKWRLYKIESQAIMDWRGSNDKTTVVRYPSGGIIEHDFRHTLVEYCKETFKQVPLQESEVSKLSFEEWLREVDREVIRRTGLDREALPDVDYSGMYASGLSAGSAALRVIRNVKGELSMASSKNESMPCPRCKKLHERGDYVPRPELARKPLGKVLEASTKKYGVEVRSGTPLGPLDVDCECGAKLRHVVPLFAVNPYGWRWEIL